MYASLAGKGLMVLVMMVPDPFLSHYKFSSLDYAVLILLQVVVAIWFLLRVVLYLYTAYSYVYTYDSTWQAALCYNTFFFVAIPEFLNILFLGIQGLYLTIYKVAYTSFYPQGGHI